MNNRKNIMISLGQIPAKLDAVKYVGNRFGGGLMLKLAQELSPYHNITIVKWKYNKIDVKESTNNEYCPDFKIVDVDDIMSYHEYVKKHEYDAYILGAAVANLMPVEPWKGKFPSHNYKEGDTFDIKFKIAPRVINIVKQYHPKSTLIGFKLSTGCYLDANEVLHESKSDLVVYNNPKNLQETILCYKTGLTENVNRIELWKHINNLINVDVDFDVKKYRENIWKDKFPFDELSRNIVDINLNTFFLFKEMEKYVLDEDKHGSIFFRDVRDDVTEFYTHSRYNKDFASVMSGEKIDKLKSYKLEKDKYTQALPVFLFLQEELPEHNYFIHTHKPLDIKPDVVCGYLPPNCSIKNAKSIILNEGRIGGQNHLSKTKNRIAIKSFGHGYFIAYRNIEEMINDFSDRNWMYYDPPKRYINDNSDIFNDILPRGIENCLEIGDNYYHSKITEGLKRYNIDPYTANSYTYLIPYDILIAKNCIPIIGLKAFEYYTKLSDNIIFNFPKKYDNNGKTMDRIEECASGDMKREISHIVGDKVFHSLMIKDGKTPTKENDTFHVYDKVTEKSIYDAFSKNFEINFRYTSGAVWCLMTRK